ncbi:MAG: efflux transporter outer membrane subunit [Rhodocyclales bacterium]|nr:efflux transporter outer membrane subunit [Rhodocyclales bacterium]
MTPSRPILFVALLAALGGCSQIPPLPDSARNMAFPGAWATADAAIKPAAVRDLSNWWRQLGDPVLDEVIEKALTAAPDMRTAQARLTQVRAGRDLAVAGLFPSLGASASAKRSKAGTAAGGSGAAQTLYAAGFDASWEPSIFGGQRDAASGAEADVAASEATLDSTRVSLAAEVALEYVTLRTYQQRLTIARDNAASQAETLQITDWKQRAGLATSLDVEQARTNLEQSRASIPSLETGRAEAEHRLAVLTGQPPGSLRELLPKIRPLPAPPDEVAVGIPADTIRQRPDVRAAEFALRGEIARSAEQRAARYPSFTLSGSWGWQAFSTAALGGSDTLVRSLAGSLAATLFDGGRISARIEAQNAVEEQALVAYQASILSALEDVENALVSYAAGRERLETHRRAAESARNAALLARTLYEAGSADFQKVLDTDRTRLSAEDGLASAEGDLLAAVVKLYKALGGGWRAGGETTDAPS